MIGRFQQGTAADVAMAISAAEAARPMWRRTPAPKRGEILYAFGALMAQHKERLARAMTREMGKVLSEARGDVQEGIDIAYLMAGEGRRMFGDTVPSELPDKWAMSIRQPIGVAGIITPWNFPMAIPCWKMMPALVTGNTVVFKPASDTPHCATLLVELMAEAGFPPGVVNLVTGTRRRGRRRDRRATRTSASSRSPAARRPGKAIAEKAGRRLKRLSLELGGKNGVVVLADADLDLATDGILWSAFGTTGQRCTAVLPGDRRARASSTPLLERARGARSQAAPRAPGSTRRPTSGRSSTPAPSTRSPRTSTSAAARASWSLGGGRATVDGDLARRPLLRADDLRRRRSDGPDRPGGDLRAGAVGHPGRRLRRGDDWRSTRPATASRRASSPAT